MSSAYVPYSDIYGDPHNQQSSYNRPSTQVSSAYPSPDPYSVWQRDALAADRARQQRDFRSRELANRRPRPLRRTSSYSDDAPQSYVNSNAQRYGRDNQNSYDSSQSNVNSNGQRYGRDSQTNVSKNTTTTMQQRQGRSQSQPGKRQDSRNWEEKMAEKFDMSGNGFIAAAGNQNTKLTPRLRY